MREGLALSAIGSAALLTLAAAGAATLRHANDLSSKERQALDNSINRIVVEQVARRDDVLPSTASAAKGTPTETTGTGARDITQWPSGPEARREAARQNRDPEERAEREARAARAVTAARPAKKRQPQGMVLRPDRVLPNAFLTIRKLTFGVL
jgi:hypothetical protein